MARKLNEGLEPMDLKRLVKPLLHIDRYKSKLGEDDDVVVLDFTVTGEDPAKDLANFLEKGYDWILDADVSSGEISDNKYLVFVEMERREAVPAHILRIVEEMENLTGQKMKEWTFCYGKDEDHHPLDAKNMSEKIPLSPHAYRMLQDQLNGLKHAAGLNIEESKDLGKEDISFLKRLSGLI